MFGVALFGFGLAMDQFEPNHLRARTPALAEIETRMRPNYGGCDGSVDKCQTSDQPELVLWGDSYAMHLVDALLASKPDIKMIQLTKSVCGPFLDFAIIQPPLRHRAWAESCHAINQGVKDYIERTPSVRYVVMSGALQFYADTNLHALVSGEVVPTGPALVEAKLLETMRWLKSRGIKPVFVTPMPIDGRDVGDCIARSLWLAGGTDRCAINKADAERYMAAATPVIDGLRKAFDVINLADSLCDDKICRVVEGDTIIYLDAVHMTHEGSAHIGKKIGLYDRVTRP